ncbi:hypothetical protein OsJ_30677 [Oryza sativa Japonica Group]|uniref:F-box domain-containing protein n=1 Tax=Oryza sativa subsp. japonica TaxID=39947 RepID=B9G7G7_ORYSJ|nr:hypothetical protein OsJ_30677 [Oryza sativa Japonica Group]
MTSRRRRPTSPAPAQPLEDDDLLSEILLRLPPLPSSLPRASVVCSRWRLIVSDPGFLRRFQSRHRKHPLLGFFKAGFRRVDPTFIPTLDPPDRIPAARFSWRLPGGDDDRYSMFGCRHGLVLLFNWVLHRLMVWDPVTGDRRAVDIPGSFLDGHGRSLVVVFPGGGRHGAAPTILGFVEEHNEVLLCTDIGAFMVNLHSMQFKKLSQTMEPGFYHPFTSFYTKFYATNFIGPLQNSVALALQYFSEKFFLSVNQFVSLQIA